MTLLTPDLIEKAARAAYLNFAGDTPSMQGLWDLDGFERKEWLDQARAALQAIVPDVVEKCAKVADESYDSKNFADRSPKHIAASIRSLLNKEDK